jgi:hypothetical protein
VKVRHARQLSARPTRTARSFRKVYAPTLSASLAPHAPTGGMPSRQLATNRLTERHWTRDNLYLWLKFPQPPFRPFATARSKRLLCAVLILGALDATIVAALLALIPLYVLAPSVVALLVLAEQHARAISDIPLTKYLKVGIDYLLDQLTSELDDHRTQWVLAWADTLDAKLMCGARACFEQV